MGSFFSAIFKRAELIQSCDGTTTKAQSQRNECQSNQLVTLTKNSQRTHVSLWNDPT